MLRHLRNRHFLLFDILIVTLSPLIAYALRMDQKAMFPNREEIAVLMISSLVLKLLIFQFVGLYKRYWRYASISELVTILIAAALGAIAVGAVFVLLLFFKKSYILPRSIPVLDFMVTLFGIASLRLGVRTWFYQHSMSERTLLQKRALIVGAGDAGTMMLREIINNRALNIWPIGFVDDDPTKQRVQIGGIPVLGKIDEIERLVRQHDIANLIIALPSAPGAVVRRIQESASDMGVKIQIVPALADLINNKLHIGELRKVQIEDLLRRESVSTDLQSVNAMLTGKTVLVTGAGGSIGSELCRQVLLAHPKHLILLGHGENSIFTLEVELGKRQIAKDMQLTAVIADTRDLERITTVFEKHKPEIVFHAAAHKHVPLMEANAREAVTNNVLGTNNVLKASEANNIERFVLISTDKAVNPVNVMGISKALAERLVQAASIRTGKPYVAVRFGNVLGSRGSVVPHFTKQIAAGGPVTVTDPEMERYFMTIPEAVQLVLHAATFGDNNAVYVLDMGEPVKIVQLARDLIELSGLEVDRDIKIIFTGLRPGEKLTEVLFASSENHSRTQHKKIFFATPAVKPKEDVSKLAERILQFVDDTHSLSDAELRTALNVFCQDNGI